MRWIKVLFIGCFFNLLFLNEAFCQVPIPSISLGVRNAESPVEISSAIRIIIILTILSLAPAILILMTSFTRIVIILSFVRQALGVQQLPPNQLLIGMSLFLTFFMMKPIFEEVYHQSLNPLFQGKINFDLALESGVKPLRKFMFAQTRPEDLNMFIELSTKEGSSTPRTLAEVHTLVLIPAFILSELKTAFQIGFLLFLPFLVIDIVVSSVLMSMGMMMLPPIMISLPIKIMLFTLVDGWTLVFGSIIKSFGM